jgi:hypothetical protein
VLEVRVVRPKERITFVFDRKQKVKRLADLALDSFFYCYPDLKGVVADQLIFASKADRIPLQAADYLAYEAYRRSLDPDSDMRMSYTAIQAAVEKLTVFSPEVLEMFSIDRQVREFLRKPVSRQ